jgi:predicted transcriptional regulator of viral defense system
MAEGPAGAVTKAELGSTAYSIRKAVQAGELVRLKNGVYIKPENLAVMFPDVEKIVPGGVLCLYSAWSYYGLTTQVPTATFIAIERSRKIVVPDYPPITLCFWTMKYCTTGVSIIDAGGYDVKIFDLEKSVCDAVRFRTKIGMDVCSEIIKNYLRRSDKNIGKLMEYANSLRVGKTLRTYLEIEL